MSGTTLYPNYSRPYEMKQSHSPLLPTPPKYSLPPVIPTAIRYVDGKPTIAWAPPLPPPLPAKVRNDITEALTLRARGEFKLNLRPHQFRAAFHAVKPSIRGIMLYHGLGSGKTITAISIVELLGLHALVIVPSSLIDNFEENIKKVGASRAHYTIISYEKFYYNSNKYSAKGKVLIVDESHRLRQPPFIHGSDPKKSKGKMALKLLNLAYRAKKVILLTGTPVWNHPHDTATQFNMILGYEHFPLKRSMWVKKYGLDGMDNPEDMVRFMRCYVSYYKPDKTDSNYPTVHYAPDNVYEMSEGHAAIYQATEEDLITPQVSSMIRGWEKMVDVDLDDGKSFDFNVFLNGARRVANFAEDDEQLYQRKIEEIVKHIKRKQKQYRNKNYHYKALIFSTWVPRGVMPLAVELKKHNISYGCYTGYKHKFKPKEEDKLPSLVIPIPKKPGKQWVPPNLLPPGLKRQASVNSVIDYIKGPYCFNKKHTSISKRNSILEAYNQDKFDVLIVSSAGGEGVDLKNTNGVYILEPHWNLEKINQAIGRAARYQSHTREPKLVQVHKFYMSKPKDTMDDKETLPTADILLKKIGELKEAFNLRFMLFMQGNSIEQNKCKT